MNAVDLLVLGGIALGLAGALLVVVPVAWGGTVPLGLAVVVALPPHLQIGELALVSVLATAVVGLASLTRHTPAGAAAAAGRVAVALIAAHVAAAYAVTQAHDVPALAVVTVAAVAVLAGEIGWRAAGGPQAPTDLRAALPVHLAVAFAGAMLALAVVEVGVAMGTVVAFPLLIARFAFQRHAEATETLRQTVQALGLVPELTGVAPLGHSERAARYASAVARELGLDEPSVERVVTATRLHHLGAVCDDDGAKAAPAEVAAAGATVLRAAGFPLEVVALLEQACVDGDIESPTLEAGVVRVAAAFDHAVGADAGAADRGLALVGTIFGDRHGRRAAAALLTCAARDPELVASAIDAGARFSATNRHLDIDATVEPQAGELLPFIRRS
jgi:hypothetical protein